MIKYIVVALFAMLSGMASAQSLGINADPYASGPNQPVTVTMSGGGANAIPCAMVAVGTVGAKFPRCDISNLPVGSYTLVMTVSAPQSIVNVPGSSATVTYGGTASSAPFALTIAGGTVPLPSLLRVATGVSIAP